MVGSNHGGGYVYSLCPANETLAEACFQKTTLRFVGDWHNILIPSTPCEYTM